jgi:hypothetical protein
MLGKGVMPSNSNNQGLLSSWKEIAGYLGCDERTCRRWELDYGLPVHRMQGAARSRVYGYKDELDTWQKSRLNGNEAAAGTPAFGPSRYQPGDAFTVRDHPHKGKTKKIILWFIPLAAIIVAAAVLLIRSSPGQAADLKINGSTFTILDENRQKLWDFDAGLQNLWPEKEYRERFQFRRPSEIGRPLLPLLVIRDINQDGKVEVLFALKTNDEHNEPGLFCLSWRGKGLWHYRPGSERQFGAHVYSSEYRIYGFEPYDINNDGSLEVFIITAHNPHSPSQLVVLDCQGKVWGEFVNWGRLEDIAYLDIDADGKKEILVAGLNDEYRTGFLAVFDASDIRGSSPQTESYACKNCGAGSEKYYLIFPRTDVDKILAPHKEGMECIDILPNGRIQLRTGVSNIYFILDSQLRLLDVQGSDFFWLRHRELWAAGKISSELNDAYYENVKKGVLYWDGTQWTSTPTMNLKRNNRR